MAQQNKTEAREIITAKVSREAAEGWRNFCAANGISITAFIEVAGRELAAETNPPVIETRQNMVLEARKIDMERRSRKR